MKRMFIPGFTLTRGAAGDRGSLPAGRCACARTEVDASRSQPDTNRNQVSSGSANIKTRQNPIDIIGSQGEREPEAARRPGCFRRSTITRPKPDEREQRPDVGQIRERAISRIPAGIPPPARTHVLMCASYTPDALSKTLSAADHRATSQTRSRLPVLKHQQRRDHPQDARYSPPRFRCIPGLERVGHRACPSGFSTRDPRQHQRTEIYSTAQITAS